MGKVEEVMKEVRKSVQVSLQQLTACLFLLLLLQFFTGD